MEKKKTSYKLLSIDLDGTLLSPVLKKADKRNYLAIQEYMSLGGHAFINTGRPPWAVAKVIQNINKCGKKRIRLLSCLNGSYIIDFNDHNIRETKISHEYCNILLNIVKKFKRATICFYTVRGFEFHQAEAYPSAAPFKAFYRNAVLVKLKNQNDLTSYKINIFSPSKKIVGKIYHEMKKQNLHQIMTVSHSSPRFLEITAANTNKGTAIALMAKKYHISKHEIAAIGDSFNDEPAFAASALSIGIAPQDPFFLERCDRIVNRRKRGVEEAINTYIIKQQISNQPIKLIFSDLDGTLIDGKTKLYSEKTRLALQQCTNHLIPLAIASGRRIYDALNIVKEMKLNPKTSVYIIGNNGATMYDLYTKKYVSQTPIDHKDAKAVFDYVVKLNNTTEKNKVGLIIHPHEPQLLFYNPIFWKPLNLKKTGNEARYDPWVNENCVYVEQFPDNIMCYKFVIKFATTEKAHFYCEKIKKAFKNLEICLSSPVNVEVNHKGVDKAFAAKTIAKLTNIRIEDMLILGDSQNDIPALRLNKNSYTPGYSPSYVKKEAAHVVRNVDASNFASEVIYKRVFKVKQTKQAKKEKEKAVKKAKKAKKNDGK